MEAREEDFINKFFIAGSHDHVLFFTDRGRVFLKKVWEVPEGSRTSKGKAIVNFIGIDAAGPNDQREKIAAIVPVSEFRDGLDLVTCTTKGLVKRTELRAYGNIRSSGIIGVAIEDGDTLLRASVVDPSGEVMIGTRLGMSIRFKAEDIRRVGRDSRGVRGIELRDDDTVISMEAIADAATQQVLSVCANGYGKRTPIDEFRLQNRGGVGIIAIDASERNGAVVDLDLVTEAEEIMVITNRGQIIRTKVAEVRQAGRNTQGVRIIRLEDGEEVVGVEPVAEPEEEPVTEAAGEAAPVVGDEAAPSE